MVACLDTNDQVSKIETTICSCHQNRRLGGKKPGNLNGSCVRDPVAGDYFVISPPGARARGACPWGWCLTLCCSFEICSPLWFLWRCCTCSWCVLESSEVFWCVLGVIWCDFWPRVFLLWSSCSPVPFVFWPLFSLCFAGVLREAKVCLSVKWCEVVWSSVK